MESDFLPLDEYLTKFATDAYNAKYAQQLDYRNCTIESLRATYGYTYGYRIETYALSDFVVIHLYFNQGPFNMADIVRLELLQNESTVEGLGDEVYVVTGQIYDYDGHYNFIALEKDMADYNLVHYMDGDYAMFMDGTPVLWTTGS